MIFIASDHGGFALKQQIIDYLSSREQVIDVGNKQLDNNDDYPDFVIPLAQKVVQEQTKGIALCKSAGGVVIACNKIRGARCVHCIDEKSARHAREHNDANICAIAADWTSIKEAKKIIDVFLSTHFTHEERHVRRLQKIEMYGV